MSSVKSFVSMNEKYDRIVVLIDMDCFYCQVEEFLDPARLSGKPIGKLNRTTSSFAFSLFKYPSQRWFNILKTLALSLSTMQREV